MKSIINWEKYKSHPPTRKPNKLKIPLNSFEFKPDQIKEFNDIYHYCLEMEKVGEFHEMVLTKSKGICIKKHILRCACWIVTVKTSFIEILIRNVDARYYRFIMGHGKSDKKEMGGRRAFQLYVAELLKDNVDIKDLAIDNGYEVKQTIPKQKIDLFVTPGRTYHNAHHIDFNSAFNAGMIEAFPILEKSVKRMYSKRKKQDDLFKKVLAMTQGFMQSELVGYSYSHISKAGYEWTNRHVDELSKKLQESGRRILSYNTDGIWYQGDIYHDEDEGTEIGQWKTDHKNCKIRFKSKGAYEFMDEETGEYKPVIRGESSYERIVPKKDWVWGDIFKGNIIKFQWITGIGIVEVVGDEIEECF